MAAPKSRTRVGAVFPQREIGNDPEDIAVFTRAVEDLGYDHIVVHEHVLAVERAGRPDMKYDEHDAHHELFVLLGFMAAITRRIELFAGVLVLPQRPAALSAKQAAEVDVLSRGRLRLGIGTGWSAVEAEALGTDFHDRGKRVNEQLEVMRLLWTKEIVDFDGRWHRIDRAGLNPMPVQRPIPIWMGGRAPAAIERAARLGGGWYFRTLPVALPECRTLVERVRTELGKTGRDVSTFGLEAGVHAPEGKPDDWRALAEALVEMGVTHVNFGTTDAGFKTVEEHVGALGAFRHAVPFLFPDRRA